MRINVHSNGGYAFGGFDSTGGIVNGPLQLNFAPVEPLHATNKQYVDNSITTHGQSTALHLKVKDRELLDGIVVGTTEINRLNGVSSNVQDQLNSKLNLAGGTLTGTLTLSGNPTVALHAAPKQYVDSTVSTHTGDNSLHLTAAQNTFLDAVTATATEVNQLAGVTSAVQTQLNSKVNKAGDTMTGALTLSADPTALLHAATKQYVDTGLSSHTGNQALHLTAAQNTFLDAVTATATEVNYLSGTTGNVQTQLNNKANNTNPSFSGRVSVKTGTVSQDIVSAVGSVNNLEVISPDSSGAAFMSFHRPSAFAAHFGIDTDNKLKIGGWSLGSSSYAIYHEGFKPTKSDVGLSNVDNTSDLNKPISTQVQTALNTKISLTGSETITNKDITAISLKETKVVMGASNSINLLTGNLFTKTLTAATTFVVENVPANGNVISFILELTNGGNFAITWFAGIKWSKGTAPTFTANGTDIIGFYSHDGGATWRGVISKDHR